MVVVGSRETDGKCKTTCSMSHCIFSSCLLYTAVAGCQPFMSLSFPVSEDVCGMNFLFSFLFCSPSFIPVDFGSDHVDLMLSFDSLRWSFAMSVAYNPISVLAGKVLIATRKRLNLTKLRNPSCTVSQCAASHPDISGILPYRIESLMPQNFLGSQAVSS